MEGTACSAAAAAGTCRAACPRGGYSLSLLLLQAPQSCLHSLAPSVALPTGPKPLCASPSPGAPWALGQTVQLEGTPFPLQSVCQTTWLRIWPCPFPVLRSFSLPTSTSCDLFRLPFISLSSHQTFPHTHKCLGLPTSFIHSFHTNIVKFVPATILGKGTRQTLPELMELTDQWVIHN